MKTIQEREHIYTIENFWSAQHCEDYIAKAENIGYEPATILTANGPRLVDSVRNNSRVLYKDIALAGELWSTLESLAPKAIGNNVAIGLNELFRFYKYQPGQQFRRHRDNSYIRNLYEVSFFTFMIYLNDNFTGGATVFEDLIVKPKQGSALIFYHPLLHEGGIVLEGTKYVLRTDIMYRLTQE